MAFKPRSKAVFAVLSGMFPCTASFKGSGPRRALMCLMELPESCNQLVFLLSVLPSSIQVGW